MASSSNGETGSGDARAAALRSLPSVGRLAGLVADRLEESAPEAVVVGASRDAIAEARQRLLGADGESRPVDLEALVEATADRVRALGGPALEPVINATGVLLHTGLGRAPLGPALTRAAGSLHARYVPVELDMASGGRGKRRRVVEDLLTGITGAEAATVVNNNAAAMVVTLAALATGREVAVSRGELVEIGGSFRLPEIVETGGARLREVGTTNRTRAGDYERAIGERTGALLKVHPSNYRVEGFASGATIAEVAAIGRARGVPVIDDIGSGLLTDALRDAFGIDEPTAEGSLRSGADLVLFSADKLLGGPQAGVIVGRRDLVDRIERHPLMRAVRVDKLTLGVLGETLKLLRDPEAWEEALPVLRLVRRPAGALREAAERIAAEVRGTGSSADIDAIETEAFVGGGSAPGQGVASMGVRIRSGEIGEAEIAARLRRGSPGVVGRVHDGSVILDLRSVLECELDELASAVVRALHGS